MTNTKVFMSSIEFISYKKTPQDSFCEGIITIRYYGQQQKYRLVRRKDGGVFIGTIDYTRQKEDGTRIYEKSISFEDPQEMKDFFQFIRDSLNQYAKNQQQQPVQNHETPPQEHSQPLFPF